MGDSNAPSASAVSAYMNKAFARSDSSGRGPASRGFRVSRGFGHQVREVDWVAVDYEPGWSAQFHYLSELNDPAGLLKVTQKMLNDYAEYLGERYDVARNDEDGSEEWNCLLVRKKAVDGS